MVSSCIQLKNVKFKPLSINQKKTKKIFFWKFLRKIFEKIYIGKNDVFGQFFDIEKFFFSNFAKNRCPMTLQMFLAIQNILFSICELIGHTFKNKKMKNKNTLPQKTYLGRNSSGVRSVGPKFSGVGGWKV